MAQKGSGHKKREKSGEGLLRRVADTLRRLKKEKERIPHSGERRRRMKKSVWVMTMILAAGLAMQVSAEEAVTESATESGTEEAVRVGSLKGPTSMGLVSLMQKAKAGETKETYDFTMATAADELLGKVISGDLDIALVPANVASVLYNKTEGGVEVIDINTLGVLYIVENGDSVQSIADLKGKTLYLTGKGTTPDYVIQYLLAANNLTTGDVTLEYKSEATEVAAALAEDTAAIGLLPQPFVTAAMAQNDKLRVALDLTQEWDAVQQDTGSRLVTGVTIARTDFVEENEGAVKDFLAEHAESTAFTNENPEQAAKWIAELEIVAKAPIAQKAIPACNITCLEGTEMKDALGGYLDVLYQLEPTSVGGALPADDFYYGAE